MKMLQKVSFMALVAMVLILGTQCDSLADSGVMRYRVTQNGATITPRISFAADRLRTIPRPPNKRCGKAAGTISGAVQIPIDTDDSSGVACCYSLVKGFWQHAGNAEFHQGAGYVVLSVLILNDDSVVKVESATGSKLSDVPVRVVNPGMRGAPISADVDTMWLPETDPDYLDSYSVLFNDHSSYTFKSDMKTDSLGSYHFNVPASYPLQAIYAAKYLWFYRHNDGSWYYMDRQGYTQLNISGFPNVGKWDWMVMALDSAGNVIAQSEERTINITAATTSAVSKRSLAVASISKESCEVLDFSKKVEDLNLPSGIVIADKDKK